MVQSSDFWVFDLLVADLVLIFSGKLQAFAPGWWLWVWASLDPWVLWRCLIWQGFGRG